tara:strand:+ start:99 stop:563 length:465 start_codon:yes stop_codon:yes gene_type:complete
MKRLIISVTVCLFCASVGWTQSGAPGRVTVTAARIGANLLLTADIPAAAVADTASAANTRLQTLSMVLRDVSRAFLLPEAAGCEVSEADVIRHSGNADAGPGISAGWEFICTNAGVINTIGVTLFSEIPVESMDGFTFPDGQQVIFADNPVMPL